MVAVGVPAGFGSKAGIHAMFICGIQVIAERLMVDLGAAQMSYIVLRALNVTVCTRGGVRSVSNVRKGDS